jgi:hypothetical protein
MWGRVENMMKKQSQTADEAWFFSVGVARRVKQALTTEVSVTKLCKASEMDKEEFTDS